MNIVIMGGSFNPPIIANLKVMQAALDPVNARAGFPAPVSFPYLKRKMPRAGQSRLFLSDDPRIRMPEAMAAADSRIRISPWLRADGSPGYSEGTPAKQIGSGDEVT